NTLMIIQTFTYGMFVLSLLTNSIFIWISTTTKCDSIGRYSYLMTGFAVIDILVSITHLVLMPGIQLTSAGYMFFRVSSGRAACACRHLGSDILRHIFLPNLYHPRTSLHLSICGRVPVETFKTVHK
ncbi:hypothetical protein PMAYCL1PPCAC_16319, partial [Pristionchus mayeri]